MEKKDLELLWNFTLRTPMFIGLVNKDTVSSFIQGYEMGRDNECDFIERILDSINDEYKIKKSSSVWSVEIDRLAEKINSDWVTTFKRQSFRILTKEFDTTMQNEFSDSIRKRINSKINSVGNHIYKFWIIDWFEIVDLEANWFQEIWSEKELKLITELDKELKTFGNIQEIETGTKKPTEKLKSICTELHEEMNKH